MRRAGLGVMLAVAALGVTALSARAAARSAVTATSGAAGAAGDTTRADSVAPPIPREFRGVWVATVANIDWPSKPGLPVAQQQAELIAILDRSAELHLNAVVFQVRPSADALYASDIEPWSEYLTGEQGKAPSPRWDPLAFAVREAHARGLELHAWFNPYRAQNDAAKSPNVASHIARTNPALVKRYGRFLWMDPGEPQVRARTLRVVLDVVKRYDIDGVHIDDYFYPYPIAQSRGRGDLPFPDDASWAKYQRAGGKLSRNDWRRENVNTLVRELAEGIRAEKPWVKFGISPFGIWRPGSPSAVRGFDAYEKLYADARKWMHEGWGDYFSPQLYWPTYKEGQQYSVLLDWWAGENRQRRHLWPGNFTSRAGARGSGAFAVSELLAQIQATRTHPGSSGNVHFSMRSFSTNQAGMNDTLSEGPYREPALVPHSPWMSAPPPPEPRVALGRNERGVRTLELRTADGTRPWLWVVRMRTDSGWQVHVVPGARLSWSPPFGDEPLDLVVSTVNRIGEERTP
jgi:uncharacterized lipoprotein YddW (UPF0748 family)